jgi:hypothetical protein
MDREEYTDCFTSPMSRHEDELSISPPAVVGEKG